MDANQFSGLLQIKTEQLRQYASAGFPRMAGGKILRFIDGNFRAQGWQGRPFLPWAKNKTNTTILVKSGTLRRSFRQSTAPGEVTTWTNCAYARVHNRGFNGTVNVRAFTRNKFKETKIGTGRFNKSGTERMKTVHQLTGPSSVKAHTRKMNIPKRQFMPENISDSPILEDAIRKDIIKTFKQIFN